MKRGFCVLVCLLSVVNGLSESLRRCVIMMYTRQTDSHRFNGRSITVSFALGYNVTELEETAKILGDVVMEFRKGESAEEKEHRVDENWRKRRMKCAFCEEGERCFQSLYFWQSFPPYCTDERKKQHEKDCRPKFGLDHPCVFQSRPGMQFNTDHEIVLKI